MYSKRCVLQRHHVCAEMTDNILMNRYDNTHDAQDEMEDQTPDISFSSLRAYHSQHLSYLYLFLNFPYWILDDVYKRHANEYDQNDVHENKEVKLTSEKMVEKKKNAEAME